MKVIRINTLDKLDKEELEKIKFSTIANVVFKGDICILEIEDLHGSISEIQLRPQQ